VGGEQSIQKVTDSLRYFDDERSFDYGDRLLPRSQWPARHSNPQHQHRREFVSAFENGNMGSDEPITQDREERSREEKVVAFSSNSTPFYVLGIYISNSDSMDFRYFSSEIVLSHCRSVGVRVLLIHGTFDIQGGAPTYVGHPAALKEWE